MNSIKSILLLIVLLQSPAIYSQLWSTRTEKLNIDKKRESIRKSRIKSKTLYIYTFEDDKMSKKGSRSLWETEKYDTCGNTIEKYEFSFSGKFYKIKDTFDEKNRLTLSLWCDSDGNSWYSKREYLYTDNNIVIEKIINKENPSYFQLICNKYDNSGNLIETLHSGGNGYSRNIYEYDNRMNLIVQLSTGSYIKGFSIGSIKNVYNSSGYLISTFSQSWENSDFTLFNYIYDEMGNKTVEIMLFHSPKYLTISKYRYDEFGNLIYEYWNQGDGYPRVTLMKYDENGNMLEKLNVDENGKPHSLYKYVYEYYE